MDNILKQKDKIGCKEDFFLNFLILFIFDSP